MKAHEGGSRRFGVLSLVVLLLSMSLALALTRTASGYTPHAPISIVGNGDFTPANGVVGGDGTPSNPYVIAGWEVDTANAIGIRIQDTYAPFVIRGVYLHTADPSPEHGVFLQNVTHGRVEASVLEHDRVGVYLYLSSDIAVANTVFTSNTLYGLYVLKSGVVRVSGDSFGANYYAVRLETATDVVVEDSSVTATSYFALTIDFQSSLVTVRNSNISSNFWTAIGVTASSRIRIEGNTLVSNYLHGVAVGGSTDVLVRGNNASYGTGAGIEAISSSVNVTAEGNWVIGNHWGLLTMTSTRIKFHHNRIIENDANAYDDVSSPTAWDDGYPSGGNYWSDYRGVDNCSGAAQNVCPDPDGFGDTPRWVSTNRDRYPLMAAGQDYTPPTAAVLTSATLSGPGWDDVTLTWNRSADEGTPGGTVAYAVLQATAFAGPYAPIATYPANGSAAYSHTCVACGHIDPTPRFFRIRALDNASNKVDGPTTAAKYTKSVSPGQMLLTLPLEQVDLRLPSILRTVVYDIVRVYRAADASDPWKAVYAGRSGDLDTLRFGEAFWVNVTAAGRYTVAGLVRTNPTIRLLSGWNLPGYAAFVSESRAVSLAGVPGVARVQAFDSAADPYRLRAVPPGELLIPGEAYWVFLTSAGGTWVQG